MGENLGVAVEFGGTPFAGCLASRARRRGILLTINQNLSTNGSGGRPNMTTKMTPCALTGEAANHAQ